MRGSHIKTHAVVHWLKTSVYSFPIIAILMFSLLVAFKINGSSTAMYYSLTHGAKDDDPGLLLGHPQSIRSDEWLTVSAITASQYKADFPQFNEKLGSGRDVAIVPDAPTKNWLTFFRPQNWSFFILPFEYAFSFRWWFGLVLLIVSAYFFTLRMLNENKLIAILLSLSFSLSPFFLWWYRSDLLIPAAYSFMMLILGIRIINQEKIPRIKSPKSTNAIYILALSFLGASFILLLYAPFLIPLFIVVVFFLFGYLLNQRLTKKSLTTKEALQRLCLMLAPILIIAPIVLLFAVVHKDMIHAISNSLYPGHRLTESGELPFSAVYRFFDSFLMALLPHPPTGRFYANQSESANFILLLPFLLIPGILLQVYDYLKSRRIDWTFLLIQLLSLSFILRISAPVANGLFKPLLLDRVPNNRLMVGIGLLGFLQLVYLVKYLQKIKVPKRKFSALAASLCILVLGWLFVFSNYIFHQYLVFDHARLIVGFLAVFFTAIIAAFMFKKNLLGATLLLSFTLVSSYKILPLQRGLPFFEDSVIINKIERDSGPDDSWAVVDNFPFETLPLIAGRQQISGPQIYPDLKFWQQLDKDRELEYIYNREAHALFISDTAQPGVFLSKSFAKKMNQEMELVKGNVFKVRFTCSEFIYRNINFVLTTHKLVMPCVVPVDRASYPQVDFYIYQIKPAH